MLRLRNIFRKTRALFDLIFKSFIKRSEMTLKIKFVFSKKATKIDEIFTVDLTLTTLCQIHGEDFVNFCGLLGKREL